MAALRVCAITFDWYPFDSHVRRMSEAAINAGFEADVICLRPKHEKKFEVCQQVRTYRVPMDRGFGKSLPATILNWFFFMLLAGFTVTRLHLKRPYDVIHVHNMPDFLVFAALIPKLLGAKVVLDVQDTSPELMAAKSKGALSKIVKSLAAFQERISTSFADHVITVGWPFERLLLKRKVPAKKLTIILNSADPGLFPPERRPALPAPVIDEQRPFTIIYHGTLAHRTGLDIAVRALAIARKDVPQARLLIKGRGEQLPFLKELTSESGLDDVVLFSDPCPAEEIVDFVVQGDVGVIPYRCDGFEELVLPTKAYEYTWMHIPVIGADTAGIRSMYRPEGSVILCKSGDPESFARAFVDLYRHPEKRAQMITNAAEDFMPYRWELMSQRYCDLLQSLKDQRTQKKGQGQPIATANKVNVD
jgi:glycosyltransferase involved in cell wall biosynthesis